MPGCQKSEKNSLQIKQKKDWIKPETLIKKSKRELDTQMTCVLQESLQGCSLLNETQC